MTDKQLQRAQRKIAEVLGWTKLKWQRPLLSALGEPEVLIGYDPDGNFGVVPNWPGSLDAARELGIPEKHRRKFAKHLTTICGGSLKVLFATAYQWCLAWLLSEHGWRWVPCDGCVEGREKCPDCDSRGHLSHSPPQPIPKTCDGKGGEWINE